MIRDGTEGVPEWPSSLLIAGTGALTCGCCEQKEAFLCLIHAEAVLLQPH